ncbi:hypothetical protein GCM10010977_10760 [Citricoccus zhacaiensis]|uniref:CsbD-like domain-containing protein n=2 Tax=Citricoccus zhacaiensis TaxID=489142 RepID=A0ABQ2LTY9_9MICC|nr:hypothetical protein GCM10010977_10760 [Citricoccus zhacaiensis]
MFDCRGKGRQVPAVHRSEEETMGTGDRFENKADEVKGQAKQGLGDVTDNDRLKNEGRADEAKAGIKDKVEDVKDAAKDIFGGNKNT